VGIVFFNVDLLRMNRDITQMAERADRLNRENARIREEVAHLASSERIQEAAARLGLVLPAPGDVRYLESNPRIDARNASRRIIPPTEAYPTAAPVTADPEPQPPPAASSTTTTTTTTTTTPPTASVPPTTTTPTSSAALPAAGG
jgi:cell division protein FtsL